MSVNGLVCMRERVCAHGPATRLGDEWCALSRMEGGSEPVQSLRPKRMAGGWLGFRSSCTFQSEQYIRVPHHVVVKRCRAIQYLLSRVRLGGAEAWTWLIVMVQPAIPILGLNALFPDYGDIYLGFRESIVEEQPKDSFARTSVVQCGGDVGRKRTAPGTIY